MVLPQSFPHPFSLIGTGPAGLSPCTAHSTVGSREYTDALVRQQGYTAEVEGHGHDK